MLDNGVACQEVQCCCELAIVERSYRDGQEIVSNAKSFLHVSWIGCFILQRLTVIDEADKYTDANRKDSVINRSCTGVVQNGFLEYCSKVKIMIFHVNLLIYLKPARGFEPRTC
jgi:hypothetical protein